MPRGPVMVLADRIRLEQVIINLLRNALDATKDLSDPQIDILVTVGRDGDDDGARQRPGITDLENLFEPFYTTKEPGEGVGLGLAISSGIVTDLGRSPDRAECAERSGALCLRYSFRSCGREE